MKEEPMIQYIVDQKNLIPRRKPSPQNYHFGFAKIPFFESEFCPPISKIQKKFDQDRLGVQNP
jgi:hypothetical protein